MLEQPQINTCEDEFSLNSEEHRQIGKTERRQSFATRNLCVSSFLPIILHVTNSQHALPTISV